MEPNVKYCHVDAAHRKTLFSPLKNSGYVPEKGSEIFVSSIPASATVYDLARFFETVGDLYQVKLMMDEDGVRNRGYAFVTYMNSNLAKKALASLRNKPIIGARNLLLQRSVNNCRLFVGGIPVDKTKNDVWHELKTSLNITNVVDVIAYRNYAEPAHNRGYVFLEFRTHEEASHFRAKYHGKLVLFGRLLVVDWSVPVMEAEEGILNEVKVLFLKNLDVTQSSENFARQIYGHISRTVIEKVYKFKDYAFIHLATRDQAERLMTILKGFYDGTSVEVTWAKPPNKFSKRSYRDKALINRQTKLAASLPDHRFNMFTDNSTPFTIPERTLRPQHTFANYLASKTISDLIAQCALTSTDNNDMVNVPGTSSGPYKAKLVPAAVTPPPFVPRLAAQYNNVDSFSSSFYTSPFQMPSLVPNWEVMKSQHNSSCQ